MSLQPLLDKYQHHPTVPALAQHLENPGSRARLAGAVGSQRALLLAAVLRQADRAGLIVVPDREEALYLQNDLDLLIGPHSATGRTVLLFPASSKRPYQLENIDNANVVERAEVLHLLNQLGPAEAVIVTYPEALAEQVIEKQRLQRYTLNLTVGEKPGMEFLLDMLEEYGFELADFVYEPGQYAHRGGIVDLYPFNQDLPLRVEFLGDEIESIRSFEPASQLSVQRLTQASIIPNVRTTLAKEARVPLLEYLSPATMVFVEDLPFTLDELDKAYAKAEQLYQAQQGKGGDATLVSPPAQLYVNAERFRRQLDLYSVLEIGNRALHAEAPLTPWQGTPQPSFKKEFSLLSEHLLQLQATGTDVILCAENEKQGKRLREVLEQIAPKLKPTYVVDALAEGFQDPQLKLALYTDHQIFERYHRFRSKARHSRSQALTLKELMELRPGDYVTHVNHGIGRFAGLERLPGTEGQGSGQEAVKIIYDGGDTIYVAVSALHKISKYAGKEGNVPKLNKLGSTEWSRTTSRIKKRVKELAFDLVALYARRKLAKGYAYSPDSYLQTELEASFLYEDTPDQAKATEAVKADLEAPHPMDRLVCGDVGFGKTEIAVRAAFKAITDGKQVAVLVPTTILALQHFNTFAERLAQFSPRIDYLNRFKSAAEQKVVLKKLAAGELDIVIGTHRLLSKDVQFKDLGLLIIDEEHKFGVGAKEKLRLLRANIDTLTLTATPIPRTLQFSLLGIRDLSIIATPPPNRKPVETVLHGFDSELIRDAVAYELKRRGQAFFVHNRIKDLEEMAAMIKKLVPDARVAVTHGQMDGEKIEEIMHRFIQHEFDVLVCTTIIESGLDIPNANTILINQAHTYGLSDLHQMRGRVGRSNRKAFCYLLSPPLSVLPTDSRKRLQALEEFSDLGSGMQIAMRDMDIRGAGDILGSEQHGFISEIGYDMYHRLLDEAIQELKEEHFPELAGSHPDRPKDLAHEAAIDTDQPARIPETYIPGVAERLSIYKRISEADTEPQRQALQRELQDRFGLLPEPTLALFDTIRIREAASRLGFDKVVLKGGVLRCYLPGGKNNAYYQGVVFAGILSFVQQHPAVFTMKQSPDHLQFYAKPVDGVKAAWLRIRELEQHVFQPEPQPEPVSG